MNSNKIFIGLRNDKGRYGPQSRDMVLSEFIDLLRSESQPDLIIMPDFTGLADHIDNQLQKHFELSYEKELNTKYQILSDTWFNAKSIKDPGKRCARFEKLMEETQEFIVHSHGTMPQFRFHEVKSDLAYGVRQKGQAYCQALLFHIIARVEFEKESVAADTNLMRYCRWFKKWIEDRFWAGNIRNLKTNVVLRDPGYFPFLQRLDGDSTTSNADEYLARLIRDQADEKVGYYNDGKYSRAIHYEKINDWQSVMLEVLRDLHHRADCIEMLLQELADNATTVDFSYAKQAGDWISEKLN